MDVGVFKEAQEAYARGDFGAALDGFIECTRSADELSPSDLSKFYHLIGNCYVKTGDPYAAAAAYSHALAGSPEKRKPSLYVNLGTALLGTGEYEEALTAFTRALDYPIYATPYKAYSGVGAAQLKLGNMTEAGAAYREAALDPANPDPAKALVNLGVCFMELGRAADAVTSYETALEFDLAPAARAKALANLGQAYMAEGRVNKALEAFDQATAEGDYQLSPMARHDYDIACTLKEKLDSRMPGVLDTGFIPKVELDADDAAPQADTSAPDLSGGQATMQPDASGHLPVYGEPGFDPFAPQTQDLEPVKAPASEEAAGDAAQEADGADAAGSAEASPAVQTSTIAADGVDEAELEATLEELGIAPGGHSARAHHGVEPEEEPYVPEEAAAAAADVSDDDGFSTAKTALIPPVSPNSELDIPTGEVPLARHEDADERAAVADDPDATSALERPIAAPDEDVEGQTFDEHAIDGDVVDSGEPLVDLDSTDTHMPSPDKTQFFDVTEAEIDQEAREDRKKARKSRGVGLKVAIMVVILAILVAAAGAAAYILGYGYPLQEDVTRGFFSAVQSGGDTSQYWASDVDETSRNAQTAALEKLTSYNVEAVDRSMSQTTVYVKGTLEEGGQIDYEVVLTRNGISWAIEYVELYFPSQHQG